MRLARYGAGPSRAATRPSSRSTTRARYWRPPADRSLKPAGPDSSATPGWPPSLVEMQPSLSRNASSVPGGGSSASSAFSATVVNSLVIWVFWVRRYTAVTTAPTTTSIAANAQRGLQGDHPGRRAATPSDRPAASVSASLRPLADTRIRARCAPPSSRACGADSARRDRRCRRTRRRREGASQQLGPAEHWPGELISAANRAASRSESSTSSPDGVSPVTRRVTKSSRSPPACRTVPASSLRRAAAPTPGPATQAPRRV